MSLNLIKFGFDDIYDIFSMGGEDLKQLPKSSQKIFNEITNKMIFKTSGDFLAKIYSDIKSHKMKDGDKIIFEQGDTLYYIPINIMSFTILEGLASLMHVQDSTTISQKTLTLLNDD